MTTTTMSMREGLRARNSRRERERRAVVAASRIVYATRSFLIRNNNRRRRLVTSRQRVDFQSFARKRHGDFSFTASRDIQQSITLKRTIASFAFELTPFWEKYLTPTRILGIRACLALGAIIIQIHAFLGSVFLFFFFLSFFSSIPYSAGRSSFPRETSRSPRWRGRSGDLE